jgi:DNA-binding response OmpR family regulator
MKSILLVDDETISCAALQQTLQRFGFHVEVASSAEGALRAIRRVPFDAVVVEFNLRSRFREHPRTENGLQLVRRLRASKIGTPVVVYTAMTGEEYKSASLEAGADEFIPKTTSVPCFVSHLRASIWEHEQVAKDIGPRSRPGRHRSLTAETEDKTALRGSKFGRASR